MRDNLQQRRRNEQSRPALLDCCHWYGVPVVLFCTTGVVGLSGCRVVSPFHRHRVIPPPVRHFPPSPCRFPPPASPRHFTPPSHPPRLAPPPTLAPHLIPLPLPDLTPLSRRFPFVVVSPLLCTAFSLLLLVVSSPFSASFHPRGHFSPFVVIAVFVFPLLRRPRSSSSSSTLLLLIDPPAPRRRRPSSSPSTLLLGSAGHSPWLGSPPWDVLSLSLSLSPSLSLSLSPSLSLSLLPLLSLSLSPSLPLSSSSLSSLFCRFRVLGCSGFVRWVNEGWEKTGHNVYCGPFS